MDTDRGHMPKGNGLTVNPVVPECGLARVVERVEATIHNTSYHETARLIAADGAAVWFGLPPTRFLEILEILVAELPSPGRLLTGWHRIMTDQSDGQFSNRQALSAENSEDSREVFALNVLRMGGLRMRGRVVEASEQAENLRSQLVTMQPLYDSRDGWVLHTAVQVGVTAMLAGDFPRALAHFTEARMHVLVPKFTFLTRDALSKSALIHAGFGDIEVARMLLARAEHISRTISWVEEHLDLYPDLVAALTADEKPESALFVLEGIDLQTLGEAWPFYVVALYRAMKAGGYDDELAYRLSALDSMPLPLVDGQGFSGSVIPLKRALLAWESGRGAEARQLLERADPNLAYTQLVRAAGHLYSGRPKQALRDAAQLWEAARGMRRMKLWRMAVVSAAQYLDGNTAGCVRTLKAAVQLPRGLSGREARQFSPEVRRIGETQVQGWPEDGAGPSIFLQNLPVPGETLSHREVEILQHLAQGHSRAEIAKRLFISLNTVKTLLRSVYKKLDVSSASAAVLEAERRGMV